MADERETDTSIHDETAEGADESPETLLETAKAISGSSKADAEAAKADAEALRLEKDLALIKAKVADPNFSETQTPLEAEEIKSLKSDRDLKEKYGKWFIWILIGQLLFMNGTFLVTGTGKLKFSDLTLELYIGGTIAEVFGVVLVITRHLFPRK